MEITGNRKLDRVTNLDTPVHTTPLKVNTIEGILDPSHKGFVFKPNEKLKAKDEQDQIKRLVSFTAQETFSLQTQHLEAWKIIKMKD